MKKIDIFDVVFKHKQFLEKSLYDGGKNNIVYEAALETKYAYPILWELDGICVLYLPGTDVYRMPFIAQRDYALGPVYYSTYAIVKREWMMFGVVPYIDVDIVNNKYDIVYPHINPILL